MIKQGAFLDRIAILNDLWIFCGAHGAPRAGATRPYQTRERVSV